MTCMSVTHGINAVFIPSAVAGISEPVAFPCLVQVKNVACFLANSHLSPAHLKIHPSVALHLKMYFASDHYDTFKGQN